VSISYSVNLNVNQDSLRQNINASNITGTLQTSGFLAVTLNVGTATQAIGTASASSLGLCFARSLVTETTGTHTISFGRLSGTTLFSVVRMRPRDAALLRLEPGNYAAQSNAPNARLLLQILEE
jgi:hypothetical protein